MIKTNVNSITFGGSLGKDLELKGGQNGNKQFGVVSVAHTKSWPLNDGSGNFGEKTCWMTLKFNDMLLDKIARNGGFYKGDELIVEGSLTQREVQDGNVKKVLTEIQVDSIISHTPKALKNMGKSMNNQNGGQQQHANNQNGGQQQRANYQNGGQQQRANNQNGGQQQRYNNQNGGNQQHANNQNRNQQHANNQNGNQQYSNQQNANWGANDWDNDAHYANS